MLEGKEFDITNCSSHTQTIDIWNQALKPQWVIDTIINNVEDNIIGILIQNI